LDGSLFGIYGALLGAGEEVTGPFKVNHYTEHDQREPAVAGGARGEALVVWSSYGQDGEQGGIFGRIVRAQGPSGPGRVPLLGEELGSPARAGHQRTAGRGRQRRLFAWETDGNGLSSVLSLRRLGSMADPRHAAGSNCRHPGGLRNCRPGESDAGSVIVHWWGQTHWSHLTLFSRRSAPEVLGPVSSEDSSGEATIRGTLTAMVLALTVGTGPGPGGAQTPAEPEVL
jgi:hypothetical protein